MGVALREVMRAYRVPCLFAAVVGGLLLLGATASFETRSDYLNLFWPAYERLQAGDLDGFRDRVSGEATFIMIFGAAPAYLAGLLGNAEIGTARMVALLPVGAICLLAAYFGVQLRAAGHRWWPAVVVLALYPIAKDAIRYGHSEDLLATAAAVAAVLLALEGRPKLAGALLVVAIATKPWAVLAIGPAVLAASRRPLLVGGIGMLGGGAVIKLGTLLIHPATGGLTSVGGILFAQSLWWPAAPGPRVDPSDPLSQAVAPAWMAISHPLIVALAVPLSLLWLYVRQSQRRPLDEALLLLALLFLIRCALDPWNNTYYHLPLVIALIAWDVRGGRFPWLAATVSVCVLVSCEIVGTRTGWTAFTLYVSWAIPLGAVLVWRLFGRPLAHRASHRAGLVPAPT